MRDARRLVMKRGRSKPGENPHTGRGSWRAQSATTCPALLKNVRGSW
jgi:hypothetical protein